MVEGVELEFGDGLDDGEVLVGLAGGGPPPPLAESPLNVTGGGPGIVKDTESA